MAQTQRPANLRPVNANPDAPVSGLTPEARRKGIEARKEAISPEERKLIEDCTSLRDKIKAEANPEAKKALQDAFKLADQQRKSLAFVRKFGEIYIEAEDLARRIVQHASNNYFGTPTQRLKAKAMLSDKLWAALNEYDPKEDDLLGDADGMTAGERKRAARKLASNLL